MKDRDRTREQLLSELAELRRRVAELEAREAEHEPTGKKLRESDAHYRRLVETANEGIWVIDADAKTTFANRRMAEMLGYTVQEMLGRGLLDFMEDAARVDAERYLGRRREGIKEQHDFRFRRRDGSDVWTLISTNPILDDDGQFAGALGVITDITEQKRVEEALRKREAELRRLTEQQEALLRISQAVQKIKRPSDLKRVMRVCLEEVKRIGVDAQTTALHRLIDEAQKTFETVRVGPEGILSISERPGGTGLYECWRTGRIDGEEDIEKASPADVALFRDKFGGLPIRSYLDIPFSRGIVSVHSFQPHAFSKVDVDILKQVAEILSVGISRAEDLEHQDALVRYLPEGVCLLDGKHRLIYTNATAVAYLQALGDVSAGEVVSQIHGVTLEDLIAASEGGIPHEVVVEEPSRRVFEIEARPIRREAENGGGVVVIRDVTREREVQKRAQEQDRLAAIGQLTAGIAHDFNNLLTVVMGLTQMLVQEEVSDRVKEDLENILSQGRRAAQMTRQILDFGRETDMARQAVDLAPFLKEAVKLLQRTLPEHIEFVTDFDSRTCIAEADLAQLQQVITNLAINTRDAMPGGGVLKIGLSSLRVTPDKRPPLPGMAPGNWIAWRVSDTGMGMPPEVTERVFEPFFTTKEAGKGTGLGLAQVYGIVKQHGGEIDVKSRIWEGATFTIYLPEIEAEAAPPEHLALRIPKGRGEIVLLAEDEKDVLRTTKAMLEHLDYGVFTAANGREALDICARRRDEIALVMTDMVMPKMSGLELFEELREMEVDIPVMIMTGYPVKEKTRGPRYRDVSAWLEKPLNLEDMAQAVDEILRGRA